MSSRRTFIAAGITTIGASALSGCVGFISGEDALEFSADPLRVPETILAETGYEIVDEEEITLERTFEVAGRSRQAVITNHLTAHEKTIDLGALGSLPAASFALLATPSASVLGQEFNPVGEMTAEELAEMTLDRYEAIDNLAHVRDDEIEINGAETVLGTFTADASIAGQTIELAVHVTEAVDIAGDLGILVGSYPALIPDEEAHIRTMMRAVEPDD